MLWMTLDGQGPLYLQVYRAIRKAILEGTCAPGAGLPSTRALANENGKEYCMRFNTSWLWIALVCWAVGGVAVAQDCYPVSIPAPFDRYTDVELIRQLYPNVDPATRLLGRGVVDEAGQARGGGLSAARLWKGEGESKLLAMVETYTPEDGQRPTYGAATYGLDLALFAIADGKLTLVAKLYNAADHSGHGA